MGAFASPRYLQRKGIPVTAEDLAGHECVNFRYQSTGQSLRWPYETDNKQLELAPDSAFTVDVSDAVAAVLAAGGGIGITPHYVAAPYVRRGELVPILPQFTVERFVITALWPQSRRGSPNVKAFIAFLIELFPSTPSWDEVISQVLARD
ncbi:LysR substrate-binding domain-containing protein [Pseudomonas sp. RGM2987]|uniref:LysR substrate-binding domain-containing protein n=1 Tax=Pseudomonas sp. RGM2987 TaxID=2930090 RepID=UPI001FD682DD|nr:LysR substrate-binding domain-containing protein [Pseudomonas sp. RGM2987]